jgi:hypothetical protein
VVRSQHRLIVHNTLSQKRKKKKHKKRAGEVAQSVDHKFKPQYYKKEEEEEEKERKRGSS